MKRYNVLLSLFIKAKRSRILKGRNINVLCWDESFRKSHKRRQSSWVCWTKTENMGWLFQLYLYSLMILYVCMTMIVMGLLFFDDDGKWRQTLARKVIKWKHQKLKLSLNFGGFSKNFYHFCNENREHVTRQYVSWETTSNYLRLTWKLSYLMRSIDLHHWVLKIMPGTLY
jgi:hypothetical protein